MTTHPLDNGKGASALRVGDWTVHPDLHRLSRGGETVQIEPRLMDVLVCLAGSAGQVIERRDLLDRVWGDTVVGEEALTRSVSELRRILGDDSQQPRYIETIRKGGYRLVAEVGTVLEEKEVRPAGARTPRRGLSDLRHLALAAVGFVVVTALALVLYLGRGEPDPAYTPPLSAVPLTTYPGVERYPALSPDGSKVAFTWGGPDGDNLDIYVKQVGHDNPLRLTDHTGWDVYPVWIPGDEELAYIHGDEGGVGLLAVPLLGGAPRVILGPLPAIYGMNWTPDGTQLVYAVADERDGPGRLLVRDLASGIERELTPTPAGCSHVAPLVGPGGRRVIFLRKTPAGQDEVHLVDLRGGSSRQLVGGLGTLEGACWHRNGREIIVSSRQNGDYALWRVDVDDPATRWIPLPGEWIHFPHMGFASGRLVYQHRRYEKNVWRIEQPADGSGLTTEPVLVSTYWDCEARISPDGRQMAFTSSRSGNLEIWTCRPDGSLPVQLTRFGGARVSGPRWSPDGRRLVFNAGPEGWANLFVAEVETRTITRLTDHPAHDLAPSWSGDGLAVYCGSNRSGDWQVWRIPVREEGAPRPLTRDGGLAPREGPDGAWLYFSREGEGGLWRRSLADPGAAPERVLEGLPIQGDARNWDLWSGGLVLVDYDHEGPRIVRANLDGSELADVTRVPNLASPSLTVAPDGRTIYYARIENSVGDLMLVEDVR
ncbi:MAG: hypothetical protein GY838_13785 [bacterium]|nr:hypothetical protein [bacterium]